MIRRTGLLTLAAVLALMAAASTALARGEPALGLNQPLEWGATSTTSDNWSGYTIAGTGASHVTGTWAVSQAACAADETSVSGAWVGIDGDISGTVEQTGTASECNSGTPSYFAWWEMFPHKSMTIPHAIEPGDVMTGTVDYNGSSFTLTLVDKGKWTFSTTQSSPNAARTSVEWIVEGSAGGLLTDFGTLTFSSDSATISGATRSLFGFGGGAQPITMVDKKGEVRAQPGPVDHDGNFTDTWLHG